MKAQIQICFSYILAVYLPCSNFRFENTASVRLFAVKHRLCPRASTQWWTSPRVEVLFAGHFPLESRVGGAAGKVGLSPLAIDLLELP